MENNESKNSKNSLLKIGGLLVIGAVIGLFSFGFGFKGGMPWMHGLMQMDEHRHAVISHKDIIQEELISQGEFACCLEKPCTYCIEKTPGHGEGASCHCLTDVVEGKHPCGECIGEIMEGHGNPLLAQYFAQSIAEEVGEQHLSTLKQIVLEKYDLPVSQQN